MARPLPAVPSHCAGRCGLVDRLPDRTNHLSAQRGEWMWNELAKNLGIVGIILAAGLLRLLPYLLIWASELLFKFAEWQRKIASG